MGWKLMERPKIYISENSFFRKNDENEIFLGAVNQLKNISDCIKIDPPGPGHNLKKHVPHCF